MTRLSSDEHVPGNALAVLWQLPSGDEFPRLFLGEKVFAASLPFGKRETGLYYLVNIN